ncbi:hypothetical protein RSOL_002630 [Rhizoctonia solani AG-3 Rhs1AP]|nr:hypothetical protein RSOL_002630 [Rhizoctonia solani AG-3 Rhs1AP]
MHSMIAVVLGPTTVNVVGVAVGTALEKLVVGTGLVADREALLVELLAETLLVDTPLGVRTSSVKVTDTVAVADAVDAVTVLVTGSVELAVVLLEGKEQM